MGEEARASEQRDYRLLTGDAAGTLATLPAGSVQAIVTSPPYWLLREYGVEGQLGREGTPEAYVRALVPVFRAARRVLRPDGTLWLNVGDRFAGAEGAGGGLRAKDLLGLPWMLARALRDPFRAGELALEGDRAWLAGALEGAGALLPGDPEAWIGGAGGGTFEAGGPGAGAVAQLDLLAAGARTRALALVPWLGGGSREQRIWLLRALHPHLRTDGGRAALAHALLAGTPTDRPPPTADEPGWCLRSEIIWHKTNPLPDGARDRPVRAHEHIFLFSREQRYFYDEQAAREPHADRAVRGGVYTRAGTSAPGYVPPAKDGLARAPLAMRDRSYNPAGRSRHSVWALPSARPEGGHHATFPEALARPMILAGTGPAACARCGAARRASEPAPPCGCGGAGTVPCAVLDPFSGTATTGAAALALGRGYVGIELSPAYQRGARLRLERAHYRARHGLEHRDERPAEGQLPLFGRPGADAPDGTPGADR